MKLSSAYPTPLNGALNGYSVFGNAGDNIVGSIFEIITVHKIKITVILNTVEYAVFLFKFNAVLADMRNFKSVISRNSNYFSVENTQTLYARRFFAGRKKELKSEANSQKML